MGIFETRSFCTLKKLKPDAAARVIILIKSISYDEKIF